MAVPEFTVMAVPEFTVPEFSIPEFSSPGVQHPPVYARGGATAANASNHRQARHRKSSGVDLA